NLNTKLYHNWEKLCTDLRTGKIDGAILLFPMVMDMFAKGEDIKILLLGQREGQALVVNKKLGSLEQLRGKTVLIPDKYSAHNILFWQICKQRGLDQKRFPV